jgi:hypothetical protein
MTNVLTAEDIEAGRRAVRAEQQRRYRKEHAEKYAEQRRRDRKAHPEKYAEQRRRYRQAHPERRAEEQRRYAKAHPEKKREARRRYWLAHPGKRAELRRRYRREHPEKHAESVRRYLERSREKRNARARERYKAHPEQRREKERRYHLANRARINARNQLYYVRRKRLMVSETMKRIYAAIPATYPKDVRDEIAGEMLLAVVEHRLRSTHIEARAPEFTRAYWRAHSPYETISLDAQLYAGGPTLGDRLVDPSA